MASVRSGRNALLVGRVEKLLVKLAIQSRLVLFLLQLLASLLPQHVSDAFQPRLPPSHPIVTTLLKGFRQWDAAHFLQIAYGGYTHEGSLAFFPLFPFVSRHLAVGLELFLPSSDAALICGLLLNFIGFLCVTVLLFRFTLLLFKDLNFAFLSALFFIVNPASIFFSSFYSETLFSVASYLGLYLLYKGKEPQRGIADASVCFALAWVTRSNGLLNFGYVGHSLLTLLLQSNQQTRSTSKLLALYAKCAFLGCVSLGVMLVPFALHQLLVFRQFCSQSGVGHYDGSDWVREAKLHGYVLPGDLHQMPWCNAMLPLSYAAVQTKYWDVGFLKYWQLKKLPLFLLALPIFFLSYCASLDFLTQLNLSRGLRQIVKEGQTVLPFVMHLLLLCAVGLFFINVEVTTRLVMCSSPVVFWYCARLFLDQKLKDFSGLDDQNLFGIIKYLWVNSRSAMPRFVICYFLAYFVIGTLLHCAGYPWT